jgi:hypothetical protein
MKRGCCHSFSLDLTLTDQVTKNELITPAQAEKLLTKEQRLGLDALTSRISSGLTLARDKGLSQ